VFEKQSPHPEPMPTLATIFVAIYVRISKDAQARGLGVWNPRRAGWSSY
jgi:hypothetical protein